jgi:hypothetical protein
MGLGDFLDGAIAPFAPGWARAASARARLEAARIGVDGLRRYDAAGYDRRTSGWNRTPSGATRECAARATLAWAGHDLVRNNKYAAAASPAGRDDLGRRHRRAGASSGQAHPAGGAGRLGPLGRKQGRRRRRLVRPRQAAVREMIVGGESLTVWKAAGDEPDARVVGMEGAQLDPLRPTSSRRRQDRPGRPVRRRGDRTAYWLFDEHPNDVVLGNSLVAQPRARPTSTICSSGCAIARRAASRGSARSR